MFLSLTNIKKSFGQGDSRVEVLKGIDLLIKKGEFCVLLDLPARENQLY